jgi:hypothetical protein
MGKVFGYLWYVLMVNLSFSKLYFALDNESNPTMQCLPMREQRRLKVPKARMPSIPSLVKVRHLMSLCSRGVLPPWHLCISNSLELSILSHMTT